MHPANVLYRQRLGWTREDFGVDTVDVEGELEAAIREFQGAHGLTVDGIAGPATYRTQLDVQFFEAKHRGEIQIDPLRWAVNRLQRLWMENIVEPPRVSAKDPTYDRHRRRIEELVREGLGWTWTGVYNGKSHYEADGDFAWCGAAAAWGDRQVGLQPEIAYRWLASTDRLDALGSGRPFNRHEPPLGIVSRYEILDEHSRYLTDVHVGDYLLVGPVPGARRDMNDDDWGVHITRVVRFDEITATFYTVEGNATGFGPRGDVRQGVVKTTRPLGLGTKDLATKYHARRLIRLGPAAYAAA